MEKEEDFYHDSMYTSLDKFLVEAVASKIVQEGQNKAEIPLQWGKQYEIEKNQFIQTAISTNSPPICETYNSFLPKYIACPET